MQTTTARPFKRIVILRNPASTHAEQGRQRIAELQRLYGKDHVVVINTPKGGSGPSRMLLRRHAKLLGPQTLLCIAAGDGTVGMIIEALVQDPQLPERCRQTPVFPLWGGNANDLAHMLNGNAYRGRVQDVVTNGRIVHIRPLACVLTSPGREPVTRIAACYVSFGATAFAAARLNAPDVRRNPLRRIPGLRQISDFIAGFGALRNAPTFLMREQGRERLVYERTFANGSRFAKVERLPLRLTEPAFLSHTLKEKRMLSVIPHMWEAMQKRSADRFKGSFAEFTLQQPVLAQFDGEPEQIAAGTTVCMTLADQPFRALSIMLEDESEATI